MKATILCVQLCVLLVLSKCLAFSCFSQRSRDRPTIRLFSAGSDDGNSEGKSNKEDDIFQGMTEEDKDFYRDFVEAKISKLGASIPPEQAELLAKQGEEDFLQAMKETRDEFQSAKQELGSDGAVELFLNKIKKEDERTASRDGNQYDDEEAVDEDENEGIFQ